MAQEPLTDMLASCSPSVGHTAATPLLQPDAAGAVQLTRRHWASLALYPFLSFFSPSEPWLFDFLCTAKGFTSEELVASVFPVWTYALFPCLPLALAVSDGLGHKATVLLGACARVVAGAIVVFVPAGNVPLMQLDQVMFSFFFVAKIAVLPALLFDLLPADAYQRAISTVRTFVLVGSASSALSGQLLVAARVPLGTLVVATLACHATALACALALPSRSRARHGGAWMPTGGFGRMARASSASATADVLTLPAPLEPLERQRSRPCASLGLAWQELRRTIVDQPSSGIWGAVLWLVVATSSQQLMLTYYQALFSTVGPSRGGMASLSLWNGLCLAVSYVAGAAVSAIAALPCVERRLRTHVEAVAVGATAATTVALGALAALGAGYPVPAGVPPIMATYVVFVVAQTACEFSRTAATAEVAIRLVSNGCRHFLSALVGCQLCVSVLQATMQGLLQGVARQNVARQFALISAASAVATLSLAALTPHQCCRRPASHPGEEVHIADEYWPVAEAPPSRRGELNRAAADARAHLAVLTSRWQTVRMTRDRAMTG